jgi:hypothetical protein
MSQYTTRLDPGSGFTEVLRPDGTQLCTVADACSGVTTLVDEMNALRFQNQMATSIQSFWDKNRDTICDPVWDDPKPKGKITKAAKWITVRYVRTVDSVNPNTIVLCYGVSAIGLYSSITHRSLAWSVLWSALVVFYSASANLKFSLGAKS